MKLLALTGVFFSIALIPLVAQAGGPPMPVFVKAKCDGKVASAVLTSFKEAINGSQKYQTVSALDDNGRMDTVLNVQMTCVEHNNVAAVASVFGLAKCFQPMPSNCHASLDGSSLNVIVCDANSEGACGKEVFNAFDLYFKTSRSILKLE